jgi:hypothetical protein
LGSKSGVATSGAPSPSGRPDIGGSGSPRTTTTRPGGAAAVPTLADFARSGIAKSDFGKSGLVESSFVELSLGGSGLVKSDLADPDFATSDLPGCGFGKSGLDKSGLDKSGLDKSGLDASALTGPGFAAAGLGELGLDELGLGELGWGEPGLNELGCDRPDLGWSNSPKSRLDKSNLAALLIGPDPGGGLDLSVFLLELSGAVCGGRPPATRWRAVVASGRSALAAGRKDSVPFAG